MVEHQLPKLDMWVRFPSLAPVDMGKFRLLNIQSVWLIFVFGCATVPSGSPAPQSLSAANYHCIQKGETLWRISKIYGVDLDELIRINRISDSTKIEPGQKIFLGEKAKSDVYSSAEDFSWPVKGRIIADYGQVFGNMANKGINIAGNAGADVTASRSGRVVFYAPVFDDFGKTIIIDHGDGFLTVYARNSEVFVRPGDIVKKGTAIAKIGAAGRDKNTYLHFEIRKKYLAQNPGFYLPRQRYD